MWYFWGYVSGPQGLTTGDLFNKEPFVLILTKIHPVKNDAKKIVNINSTRWRVKKK